MLEKIFSAISFLRRTFRTRFDNSPISNIDRLVEFIHTRAAYVAQTSLYGYLKTRMGREYVSIFKDEKFAPSLNGAKWAIYAACLSDLTVFAVASVAKGGRLPPDTATDLALYCHAACVSSTFTGEIADSIRSDALKNFRSRSNKVLWPNVAVGANAFTESPRALAESSPVSDEFKELDRDIVMNSVRFRWNDVRNQLGRRLDGNSLCEDWRSVTQGNPQFPVSRSPEVPGGQQP